ncbi:hypothetical protein HFP43_29490 [Streptomyces sp. SJ1-7]|nr:hypothetical protein [Streptomyces sp. SJ1-7]
MSHPLVGKSFRFDIGPLKVDFTFDSASQGSFVVEEAEGSHPTATPRPCDSTSGRSGRASI